ncbi:MAG: S41 family peptidase [Monoglobaceae bacterium]
MYIKKSRFALIIIIVAVAVSVISVGIINPFGFGGFEKLLKLSIATHMIEENYYEDIDKEDVAEMAIAGVAASTGDPYTRYLWGEDAQEYMESVEGNYCGVGLYIENDTEENLISVVSAIAGSPAEAAGITTNDKILKIDGEIYTGEMLDEAASYMRGEEGTEVELTVRVNADGSERDMKLIRQRIEIEMVNGEMLDGGIGYISMSQFTEGVSQKFSEKLKELNKQKMTSLIIDLRNNPGGLLEEAISVASCFAEEGKTVTYTLNKKGERRDYNAEGGAFIKDIPIIILVNGGSASASEVLSGALHDLGIAKLLGEKTYGKGIVQTVMGLGDDGILSVTTDRYYTPSGNCIHGIGIEPDYNVEMDTEKTAYLSTLDKSDDDQLKEAVKILKEGR